MFQETKLDPALHAVLHGSTRQLSTPETKAFVLLLFDIPMPRVPCLYRCARVIIYAILVLYLLAMYPFPGLP
jgi:hypothetical protein